MFDKRNELILKVKKIQLLDNKIIEANLRLGSYIKVRESSVILEELVRTNDQDLHVIEKEINEAITIYEDILEKNCVVY